MAMLIVLITGKYFVPVEKLKLSIGKGSGRGLVVKVLVSGLWGREFDTHMVRF